MTFEFVPALAAGLGATAAMSLTMIAAAAMHLTDMPPMPLVLGSMMSADPHRARRLGAILHYIVMGTVVFGLAYAALFAAFGSASVGIGVLIGAIHGVIFLAAMPMIPAMHPRMDTMATGSALISEDGTLAVPAPGPFGVRWGAMTPVGIVVGHAVYGLVAALMYTALI